MDRFSPIAPAQVRVLVLPIGQIERDRFLNFLRRLQREAAIISLGEVTGVDDKSLLAPKAFPQGSLLFNFTSSAQSEQHQQLSPYELFREPLLVIGIVDGAHWEDHGLERHLSSAHEHLKELHPRVVHRQLLVYHTAGDEQITGARSGSVLHVANSGEDNDPALSQSVREMSGRFLCELATYTKAMQASPSIQTPGQTSRTLQKATLKRSEEVVPGSGQNTPIHVDPSTPIGDENGSRPPSLQLNSLPPATTFDQMQLGNTATAPESKTNSKSKPGPRPNSQDFVSVHGFGAGATAEKARTRGKARVGITIGYVYLMAGQWHEALRVLVEHTSKARSLSDNLWHAKGLEGILVCLILCAWAGLDFTIPAICLPVSERTAVAHVKRLSLSLSSGESKQQPSNTAYQASVHRLSVSLPDITKLIISLYRSGEGSLELPVLIVYEAIIRLAKLLALLQRAQAELNPTTLTQIVSGDASSRSEGSSTGTVAKAMSRSAVADMLGHAQPTFDDTLSLGDHISILAGIASVYALLRMNRRKAMVIKDILLRLTGALIQARKLGAAEMGIHPAASLSAETGAETILSVVEERGGINQMISDLAQIYGVELVPDSHDRSAEKGLCMGSSFGGANLKMTIMKELVAFCEASPDPYGVVRLTASLLMSARPLSAVDEHSEAGSGLLFQEEQMRFVTIISRTIGISRHLGLPDVQASYWDPFLVRGICFQPSSPGQLIARRATVGIGDKETSENPLLYDPNASRLIVTAQQVILVANEPAMCTVALQNPLDLSVDIESLTLVTEGVELTTYHEPFILGPLRLQQIPVSVKASSTGTTQIKACRVKIRDCREQIFPIFNRPWSADTTLLVKDHGQDMRASQHEEHTQESESDPKSAILEAVVIPEQPLLSVSSVSLSDSNIMLLNGEVQTFDVVLHNTSNVTATMFEIAGTPNILRSVEDTSSSDVPDVQIEPGALRTVQIEVTGTAGVSAAQVRFVYGVKNSTDDATTAFHYVRFTEVPVRMTVNAALRAQHVEVSSVHSDNGFFLSFDLGNSWPRPLSYHCALLPDASISTATSDLPEQKGLLSPSSIERVFLHITHSQLPLCQAPASEVLHELWKRVHVSWQVEWRSGVVDLSSLSLSPEAIATIRGPPVQLDLDLRSAEDSTLSSTSTTQIGSFITCRATLHNRLAHRSSPLFVQLHLRPDGSSSASVQDDRRLATAGSLSRLLPPLAADETITVDFTLCPLVTGMLQVAATCVPADLGADNVVGEANGAVEEQWQAQFSVTVAVGL